MADEAADSAAQADSKAAMVVAAAATAVAAVATVAAAAAMVAEAAVTEAPREMEADMDVTIEADPDDRVPGHHHDEAADRHQNTTITEDKSSIASSFLCLACLNCTFLLPFFFPPHYRYLCPVHFIIEY